ncbi:MAG: sigma-70 family RNA polymerase sigma factor, partial [Chloroflexi bacterium]
MNNDLELSEVVIAAQCDEGNTRLEAFGELVRRFQDMAVGYAYSLLSDEDLAQDAAQEAFVQLYLHLNSVQDPAAIAGWFKKVVFSCCQRMIRRKRVPILDIDEARNLPGDSPDPAKAFE